MLSPLAKIRALASVLGSRAEIARASGKTFGGSRDVDQILGYKSELTIDDYRRRARRNGVANRILKAMPQATWRGGGELIEDDTKADQTDFEKQWTDLATRLKLWRVFYRADWMSGLDCHSAILLGAAGSLQSELQQAKGPEDLLYVRPYAADRLSIESYEEDTSNERFGQPKTYKLKKPKTQAIGMDKIVHWSRVIHVCEDLEEDVFGEPRLQCVWNFLDDLEKVSGGGAEAFWLQARQGIHIDIDQEIEMDEKEEKKLEDEAEAYEHQLSRMFRTRGGTVETLGSDVADISGPVDAVMGLISASTGIPQRILSGSERGELASTQDRDNWFDQIGDRREQVAFPNVISPFTDRCIKYKFLVKPKQYSARWSQLKSMDDSQKTDLAVKMATVNKFQGDTVITSEEIRDRALQMPPLTDAQKKEEEVKAKAKIAAKAPAVPPGNRGNPVKNRDQQVRSNP